MKIKSYNILFRLFSFLADKTNGAPLFVKYKLLLGTLIIGLTGTSAYAQKKVEVTCYDTIPPPKNKDKLVFSFVGLESKEIPVSTMRGGEAIITMKDSGMILCYEVIVVRHYPDDIYRRTPKKITKMSYTEVQTAPISPVGNLEAFQKWVQSNIQYSEQMKKDKLKGEVILSFAIDKKGKLVDKKVIGKLSKDADKEALRVLSLSDVWKPGTNYDDKPIKTTITISISFRDE